MQNAECRNAVERSFCILHFVAIAAFANELTVDKRTLTLDDSLSITLSLDGTFAAIDTVPLPLQNLVVDGQPSVSTEFQWINGQTFRRKVMRWSARPRSPGAALVGPVTLRASDGEVDTLAPLSIQVLPDATAGSNDPAQIMRELLATGRDPVFLVAEADKREVFAGAEVVVAWTLYNAARVQQYGLGEMPRLADFWTEELDIRSEQPQQIVVGGVEAQKLVIRRVALFPLRSGMLTVDPMSIHAAVMKRVNTGSPFGLFEGTVVEIQRRSAPLTIAAWALPPGPPVDVVGDVALRCFAPVQANGGPVSMDAVLSGRANLRAAPPPRFTEPLDGSVQTVERPLTVQRARDEARMARRWRYLIFPTSAGAFVIPPLTSTTLTDAGERQVLRCEQRMLFVQPARPTEAAPATPVARRIESTRRALPWVAIVVVALAGLAVAVPPLERSRRARRESRELIRETPAGTRAAIDEWLVAQGIDPNALVTETSDRGDAYRAVRSLLDAYERVAANERELRLRVRELISECGGG